jgi:type I restriction enzyme, S subunit
MKTKPYSSYKDSGVEWIGEVPEHWELKPLFIVGTEGKRSNKGMKESNLLSLSYGKIKQKDINTVEGLLPESFETYQIVEKNDIVFRLTDLQNDKRSLRSAIVNEKGIITSAYISFIPESINPFFLNYQMRCYDDYKVFYNLGSGLRQSLRYEELKRIPIFVPKEDEQSTIASFLDRETSRIDNLINEKANFIKLLKEKRQALITHAVTKGLDPNVKMKDSEVEWIGEVPEHWGIKKLKYNLRLQTQKVVIAGQSVIALENIESKSGKYIPTESSYQGEDVEFKAGDILFGKLRPYLAKVYNCNSNGVAFGDLLTYRPIEHFDSSFAFYSLLSEAFIRIVDSSTYGAKMPRASSEFINEMPLATPPLPEQTTIANFLDRETSKIDTIVDEVNHSIDLLKEHRSALISAAVTGKIDVRDQHTTQGN